MILKIFGWVTLTPLSYPIFSYFLNIHLLTYLISKRKIPVDRECKVEYKNGFQTITSKKKNLATNYPYEVFWWHRILKLWNLFLKETCQKWKMDFYNNTIHNNIIVYMRLWHGMKLKPNYSEIQYFWMGPPNTAFLPYIFLFFQYIFKYISNF